MRKRTPKKPRPTEDKRARFAAEYCVDHNATKAAERAGYSPKTAYAQGSRLLKDAEVRRLISEQEQKVLAKLEVTQERIRQRLAGIAFCSLKDLFDGNTLKPVSEWPDGAAGLVAGFEVVIRPGGDVVHKVKLSDAIRALELLGKEKKMFTDKVEHSGTVSLATLSEADIQQLSDEDLEALYGLTKAAHAIVVGKGQTPAAAANALLQGGSQ